MKQYNENLKGLFFVGSKIKNTFNKLKPKKKNKKDTVAPLFFLEENESKDNLRKKIYGFHKLEDLFNELQNIYKIFFGKSSDLEINIDKNKRFSGELSKLNQILNNYAKKLNLSRKDDISKEYFSVENYYNDEDYKYIIELKKVKTPTTEKRYSFNKELYEHYKSNRKHESIAFLTFMYNTNIQFKLNRAINILDERFTNNKSAKKLILDISNKLNLVRNDLLSSVKQELVNDHTLTSKQKKEFIKLK